MDSGLEKKLSNPDIRYMTNKLNLLHANFVYLFEVLGITDGEIESARYATAMTNDIKEWDGKVLKDWVAKKGENASRRKIIDALVECELIDAKENLEKAWVLVTTGGEDNQELGQAKKKPLHSEQDDYMDVEPDCGGSYTSRHVKAANPAPAQLTDENYYMSSPVKGLAYILNNKDFPGNTSLKERRGSEVDFSNMQHLFKELEYEIISHENLISEKIRETIKQFASRFNKPGANYSSAVVVLMSHGNTGVILGTDNKKVYLKDIQAELEGDECPKLQDKPKLFFIQACRGDSLTKLPSVECDLACGSTTPLPSSTETLQADLDADDDFAKNIPNNADMHLAYATTEGYISLRNNVEGSWFIQAITEVFLAHAHEESLDKLMNMVTNRVAKLDGKVWNQRAKQTPERVSRMRKTFYFLPKYVR